MIAVSQTEENERMRTTRDLRERERERERESCSWYGQLSTVTWLTVETGNWDKRHRVWTVRPVRGCG